MVRVRGHWKRYTESHPLFGSVVPDSGLVWCPEYERTTRRENREMNEPRLFPDDEESCPVCGGWTGTRIVGRDACTCGRPTESLDEQMQPKRLARRTDPATSKAAANEIAKDVGKLQSWVLSCVQLRPGRTTSELAREFSPTDNRKIGRRLPELERRGLVLRGKARRCAVTGRSAATWFTSEDGERKASA